MEPYQSLTEYVTGLENTAKIFLDEIEKLRYENQKLQEENKQLKTALHIQETNRAFSDLAIAESREGN